MHDRIIVLEAMFLKDKEYEQKYIKEKYTMSIRQKTFIIILLSLVVLPVSNLFACTNVFIYGNGDAAVARTTDSAKNMGNTLAVGFVGETNTANINSYLPNKLKVPARWKNKYGYIGYAWKGSHSLIGGINSAGVYAGPLMLGHFTKYPTFSPKISKPCLGVFSTVNYVLATSKSVPDALENLGKIQFVKNLLPVNDSKVDKGRYYLMPLHVVIRDKMGNSAVIEWLDGKTVI